MVCISFLAANVTADLGTVNKMFAFDKGISFLCVFGLPGQSHHNDAMRAVASASTLDLELQPLPWIEKVSIGVATGEVSCHQLY